MAPSLSDYFAALNALDRRGYVACFTPDALVRDPYGGRELRGEAGLNKFFDGMLHTWERFTMSAGEAYASGDRLAVTWRTEATAKSGKTARFAGVNIFTLEGEKISRLDGYWDFKAMVAQLR